MKHYAFGAIGVIGSFLANLFGGWDLALQTLIIFMITDYVTGLIVAGVFNKSTKTENGALESKAGWKGLCRKVTTLLYILIAAQIDKLLGTGDTIRNAVAIGYIANEALSILENGGLMGIPYPKKLKDAISVLKGKAEGDQNGTD
jgi:toxin secretion/phage lysis holin